MIDISINVYIRFILIRLTYINPVASKIVANTSHNAGKNMT